MSISKWESKFHKPFLGKDNKTDQELIYYIKCMTITQNVSDEVYNRLTYKNIDDITKYIEPVSWKAHFGESYFITITGDKTNGYKAVLNE